MTRDELIEILAKHGASLDGWDWDSNTTLNGNSVAEEHARYREWVADTILAIEAAGLCIVPREATEAMKDKGGVVHIYPSVYMGGVPERAKTHVSSIYRAMIEAGKI